MRFFVTPFKEAGSLFKFLVRGFVDAKGGSKLDVEIPRSKVVFLTVNKETQMSS